MSNPEESIQPNTPKEELGELLSVCPDSDLDKANGFALSGQALMRLTKYGKLYCVPGGETLWGQGEPGGSLAFILSGQVAAHTTAEFGDNRLVTGLFGAGSIVGEIDLCDMTPRTLTITARQESEILGLDMDGFARILQQEPDLGIQVFRSIMQSCSQQLRHAFKRLSAVF